MEITTTVALSALAAFTAAVAAGVAWRHRDVPGGTPATVFLAAVALWAGGTALEMAATTLGGKLFWLQVQYLAVVVVPVASVVFVAEYLGYDDWVTRRRVVALAAPLVLLALLSWTNDLHGLVRTDAALVAHGGELWLAREPGPAWWVGWGYSQVLVVGSFLGLLYGVWDTPGVFRLQVAAVFVGAGVPWLSQFVMLAGAAVVRPELLFTVTGIAFLAAVRWTAFLEVAPVARSRVVDTLPDPVFVFDGDDRLVEANPEAEAWFGRHAVGTAAATVFADAPAVAEAYADARTRFDPVAIDADATTRYATVQVERLPRVGNRPVGRIVVVRDVTRLKRREDELEAANERLETLANAIAHDLRNPLSIARGYHELAREGDEAAHEKVAEAHRRMEEIIDDTLASATGRSLGSTATVSVPSLARDAWDTVETGEATLTVRGDGTVEARAGQLRSCFENLFRNAVEHGSTGRRAVAGDSVEHGDGGVRVTVAVTDGGFVVADDGPGIPPADRSRVFDRGYSGGEGSGIGLAAVRETMTAHGWSLAVTESDAGGAAFVVATGYASLPTVASASGVVVRDADLTVVTEPAGDEERGSKSAEPTE